LIIQESSLTQNGDNLETAIHFHQQGDLMRAESIYLKLIQSSTNKKEIIYFLALVSIERNETDYAIDWLKQYLLLDRRNADVYYLLGNLFRDMDKMDQAIQFYQKAIEIGPSQAKYYNNLANLLYNEYKESEACLAYQAAISISPNSVEAYCGLAQISQEKGEYNLAIESCNSALMIDPSYFGIYSNLGNIFREMGKLDDSIKIFKKGLQLNPEHPDLKANLGLTYLRKGNFTDGWNHFEWRHLAKGRGAKIGGLSLTIKDITNKKILLKCEEGLGDTIQFLRFIPKIHLVCSEIILEVQSDLISLLETQIPTLGIDAIIKKNDVVKAYDFSFTLMSLPYVLGIDSGSQIKCDNAYLTIPLQKKVQIIPSRQLKIGLVWAGNPKHRNDRFRSVSLNEFEPLLELSCDFYSLQVGSAALDLNSLRVAASKLTDLSPYINSYLDTANFIQNLDLLISVDTSIIHLAGAMGIPSWVLIPANADWRWCGYTKETIWYPEMHLYRQKKLGQWGNIFVSIKTDLKNLINRKQTI